MSFHARPLTPDDADQVIDLIEIVFHEAPFAQQVRAQERELMHLDRGRGTGIFADAELADAELAGAGVIDGFTMSAPGGTVPLAGVLFVGVSPAFRRRGVASKLIRGQLEALHEQGLEPLAGLTASESVIYGRWGYGVATYSASFTVPRHRSGLRPVPGTDEIQLRLAPTAAAETVAACEAVHFRQVGKRAGMLVRDEFWARGAAADPEQWRDGRSVLRTVLASRSSGEVTGFARYRTKSEHASNGVATGYTEVSEIYADDLAGFAALAEYLMSLDLTGGVRFFRLPPDSPLVHLLTDFRAAEMRLRDGLYLRIVDVDRALAARTYAVPVDIVLDVTDRLCPWNAGRWRLSGDEKSATCVATTEPADLALDVRELAAAYLGGSSLTALGEAGLVSELRPGALTSASRAFATDLAPWLQFGI